jgi:hypothetical protein
VLLDALVLQDLLAISAKQILMSAYRALVLAQAVLVLILLTDTNATALLDEVEPTVKIITRAWRKHLV